jgi:type IV pilus assembly protein PilY1
MKHDQKPQLAARSTWLRGLLAVGPLLASVLGAGRANAQADVSPPPPNILLLVDTSGSMDYKTNSDAFPTCRYSGSATTAQTSERSRWIDLVEVLTGSINDYECQRLDRNSALFRSEYGGGSNNPYDALYANPYHRPVSNGCVAGPGTLAATPALFPPGAIKYHPFDNTAGSCVFNQATDGILDAYSGDVRFGLMTFDTEPRPAKNMSGLWSYYFNSSAKGRPAGCIDDQAQEVGVRNADAPPWEGRMVGFGNPALGSTDFKTRNGMIQEVLVATRPYGATPIAGMLADATTYLTADTSNDPIDSSFPFSPMSDPAKECRNKAIVLLSDGQPNMDLRPFCEPGGCPYLKTEDIAQNLKSLGYYIYVIGFALPTITVNGSPKSCSSFTAADFDPSEQTSLCALNKNNAALQACCALNRIAAAGGPPKPPTDSLEPDWSRAHFADSRDDLRSQLSQAIGANFKTTTRTPFVSASGSGFVSPTSDRTFARAFRFAAALKPGKLDQPWQGELNRGRYVCETDGSGGPAKPVLKEPDASKGDRFVDNLNSSPLNDRRVYTVIGNSPVNSDASMRPHLPATVTDGVGTYSGTQISAPNSLSTFVSSTPPEAIKVTDTTCDSSTANLDAAQCRTRYLNWLLGVNDGSAFQRCKGGPGSDTCHLVSEIFHSVPKAVAGRPSAFLVDQSYQAFVTAQLKAKRPSVIYASSNDGFLHAFKIGQVDKNDTSEVMKVNTKESNELWAFIPPGALSGIPSLYPASHQLLLDGTPSIKDVVATADAAQPLYKFRLERTLDQARGGTGVWRTILVQSYGAQRPGYFALDVTDPVAGPQFLWQVVTDSAGNQLFGRGGGTPLVTTAYLDGKEVAVAVLPGGYGEPGTAGDTPYRGCRRAESSFTDLTVNGIPEPRDWIPCYAASAVRARSLTVVRLDSGEILRTFRQDAAEVPGLPSTLVTASKIDSPMTGQPVAYPADVGAVADRVFIGDQDGALWRLNLASKTGDPKDWELELFFDGFPKSTPDFGHDFDDGQPVISAPIISVDRVGNLTVAFSTGDQEAIGAMSGLANYVWSLTELPSADRKKLSPRVNWNLGLKGALSGDRVIGEMALFSGDLFFSTVGPPSANDVCSSGSGKVWGMHYLDPNKEATGKGGVVSPSLTALVGAGGFVEATTLLGNDARGFLSGVSVAQQPTCEDLDEGADSGFFANGSILKGTPSSGKYQLFVPTGDKASTSTKPGVTPINSGGSKGVAIDLRQPAASLVVDSWASIVE